MASARTPEKLMTRSLLRRCVFSINYGFNKSSGGSVESSAPTLMVVSVIAPRLLLRLRLNDALRDHCEVLAGVLVSAAMIFIVFQRTTCPGEDSRGTIVGDAVIPADVSFGERFTGKMFHASMENIGRDILR